ncbi:hypothetical protein CLAFUW4_04291 [Fulvia fulva]|uniref:Asp/Glu/hydantoin racemase n=1 Tax=Passalora fulva TaxID=5499 RepID=A0A9Q8P7L8_PASFU|nr:uncharacterized protein CLAFUR5_04255 [Fulvia fulva]KAK4626145.1 hypothetical protein CLAFUR4_04277 [Fulvia fulva]KAK4627686.1 hypothetical protein CLAFUR0_04279 [Fulvia fulva]UJO16022.1 hypothetical protein CLAFUR5_04255 [Fulvia fulva]WPV13396.1 hypothetical protein CLAFUW4_04291 [Fulvia fulva]WPV28334.1 hypothetical protein CLAFUW7_04280 [Fulvia fulva]
MQSTQRIKLGILVPSSNTSLEPLTQAIISKLPNVSVHFSRFPVTEIALSPKALAQFDDSKILASASLLADAQVDIIGWSGTSAGWLGLDADRRLCRRITETTGIEATTSVLGLCSILDKVARGDDGRARFGLVTPYLDDVQAKILETFPVEGYDVVAESHLGRTVNVEFAEVSEETLDKQMAQVMGKMGEEPVKVVSIFCTNLRAAQRVQYWEEQYPGLIVADTVATVVWQMLKMLNVDQAGLETWGKVFTV